MKLLAHCLPTPQWSSFNTQWSWEPQYVPQIWEHFSLSIPSLGNVLLSIWLWNIDNTSCKQCEIWGWTLSGSTWDGNFKTQARSRQSCMVFLLTNYPCFHSLLVWPLFVRSETKFVQSPQYCMNKTASLGRIIWHWLCTFTDLIHWFFLVNHVSMRCLEQRIW